MACIILSSKPSLGLTFPFMMQPRLLLNGGIPPKTWTVLNQDHDCTVCCKSVLGDCTLRPVCEFESSSRPRWFERVRCGHFIRRPSRRVIHIFVRARIVLIEPQFLKKFLHFSKHRIHPELTDDAREYIASSYASLRSKQVREREIVKAK